MKFALMSLLCALIPLGFGCTSTAAKDTQPAADPANAVSSAGAGSLLGTVDGANPDAKSATPKGPAYLLRLVDYKSGVHMELVNESHTSHVDQYSKARSDFSRKVTTDEWMKGLIDYLGDQGWSKEEQRGSAPAMAQGSLRWSLEVVGPKGTSFIAEGKDTKGSQLTRLRTMWGAFIQTYNATPQFQAVHAAPGQWQFKAPEYADPSKKKAGG